MEKVLMKSWLRSNTTIQSRLKTLIALIFKKQQAKNPTKEQSIQKNKIYANKNYLFSYFM
jgi:hypothetical protein